jgi:hypothetical protein
LRRLFSRDCPVHPPYPPLGGAVRAAEGGFFPAEVSQLRGLFIAIGEGKHLQGSARPVTLVSFSSFSKGSLK